jgi:hypothetical protein
MNQTKGCNVCKVDQMLTEFHKDSSTKDGRRSTCKQCANNRSKAQHEANPDRAKDQNLRRYYGISLADYIQMLEAQDGRCKICKTDVPGGKGSFHVDHCHNSNKVRGLLCHHCNVGIGHFKDDISTLASAILYLSEHHDHTVTSN